MVSVFENGAGDLGSIPGRVIPKTQKSYFMPLCLTLSIITYGSRIKWVNPGKGEAPSPTNWCCSYRKGSLLVTLDCGCLLNLLIYIYVCVCVCDFITSSSTSLYVTLSKAFIFD